MNIILSPAKTMKMDTDTMLCRSVPVFLEEAKAIHSRLKQQSYEEIKKIWNCSDRLAEENYERLHTLYPDNHLTPALFAYEGIQYQYMAPRVFTESQFQYVERHLRILSGFYGILKPFDGVMPYRLEFGAKIKIDGYKNLYDFWGDKLYIDLTKQDHVIINLASKEYSKAVEPFLESGDQFINCVFGELSEDRIKVKATLAKMARGEMVRYLSDIKAERIEQIKEFQALDFSFDRKRSTETELVFLR